MANELLPMNMLQHLDTLANQSLELWDIPAVAKARLINVSENTTYLVEAPSWKSILRIHRPGYHSETAIRCELAWSTALTREGGIITPNYYVGKNSNPIQSALIDGLETSRYMVMFEFVEGSQPDETHDLAESFEDLGEIAAQTHLHSINWVRPQPFERLTWNLDTVFGANPTWGDWRAAPNVTVPIRCVLERVEEVVKRRLTAFGSDRQHYGLIHADMRLANLLIDQNGTRLIDFDDCGNGWYLYDFAASISFMEDSPQVPTLKQAWLKGYRKKRALTEQDAAELDSFIMLRRLALLAWIGSHIEAPEAQAMAADFARVSANLGNHYLDNFG